MCEKTSSSAHHVQLQTTKYLQHSLLAQHLNTTSNLLLLWMNFHKFIPHKLLCSHFLRWNWLNGQMNCKFCPASVSFTRRFWTNSGVCRLFCDSYLTRPCTRTRITTNSTSKFTYFSPNHRHPFLKHVHTITIYFFVPLLLCDADMPSAYLLRQHCWLAVWLSVTAGIVSKRLNVSENFFDHLIAPS